jgi:hypothetical protein
MLCKFGIKVEHSEFNEKKKRTFPATLIIFVYACIYGFLSMCAYKSRPNWNYSTAMYFALNDDYLNLK